jgi:NAD(P)-dependent dehydrogenase (short-subunit alcohol dehydrogenase family)
VKFGLEKKVAFVTGAARNIGRAIALSLADEGAWIACGCRESEEDALKTVREIEERGVKAVVFPVDVRSVSSIREAVRSITQKLGPVSVLVNNAAIRPRQRIDEITQEDWDRVHETNLRGPFFLSQAVIPGMRAQKFGRIINIGGIDQYWGNPQRPHSVASKGGLVGLTRALANETARWGVTVNMVVPGTIDTIRPVPQWYPNIEKLTEARMARIPIGEVGLPVDIASACTFLASEASRYITGQELLVTGGSFPLVRQQESEYD